MSKCKRCLLVLCLLALAFMLISCYTPKDNSFLLLEADSLMSVYPDSSLPLLRRFNFKEAILPAKVKYALLLTQAEDKNYLLHCNDSLIMLAVRYYDSVGDVRYSAFSHYYLGRVYQDMQDEAAAVSEFFRALALAKRDGTEELLCLLYGNLGQVYFQQDLLGKADSLFAQAEKIALHRNDSFNLAMGLVARGNVCLQLKDGSGAMAFLVQALVIARDMQNANAEKIVYNSLAAFYATLECPEETLIYSHKGLSHEEDSLSSARLYVLQGNAFAQIEQYDSAQVALAKGLNTDNLYTKAVAYSLLSDIKEKQGDLREAFRFLRSYVKCLDSLKSREYRTQQAIFSRSGELYGERYRQLLSDYHYYVYSLLVGVFLLIVCMAKRGSSFSKKISALIHTKNLLEQEVRTLGKMQKVLKEKEEELKTLQEFTGSVEQDKARLYLLSNQVLLLKQENKDFFLRMLTNRKSYTKLLQLVERKREDARCKENFSEEDWEALLKDINLFSNGFIDKLKKRAPLLSVSDVRFCCLFKIGFSYTEIACVFQRTLDAMYKKRNSILGNKLSNISTVKTFEEFIDSI